MSADQRRRRMVGYLPPVLQSGTKINLLFSTLAHELEQMEGGLTRLMRSRWHALARGFPVEESLANKADSELGQLAALYNLLPRRGESADYLRQRIATVVELHRTGMASGPALLRLVSLVYMARQPPVITWEGKLAVGLFSVPRTDGTYRTIRVELEDNPPTPSNASFRNVSGGQRLIATNRGLTAASPAIVLKATEREIAVPVFRHAQSGLDLIFLGRVPLNSTLTLRDGRAAFIDGSPVDARKNPVIRTHPTRFSSLDDPGVLTRFDAPESRFSVFEEDQRVPDLVLGENHWRYDTLDQQQVRSYLTSWDTERREAAAAWALPARDTPRADVRLDWTEITPATCTLRIPVDYIPPHLQVPNEDQVVPGLPGLVKELMRALEYGRCAGVRTRIEFTLPLPPEALVASEGPLRLVVETSLAEKLEPKDALTSFGSTIELHEQFPDPQEKLAWDGVFSATRFDTSRFQS